nr:hypothetical protein [Treponema socranskii]
MKAKKSLTVLFSVSALLIMTAYAGENRSANDNSFAGFDVYTFSAGDKDATYYLNENTLHIQERSLGSRYNSYDQTITFSTVEKAGVPYISTKTTLIIHDHPYGNLEKGIDSNLWN